MGKQAKDGLVMYKDAGVFQNARVEEKMWYRETAVT